MAAGDEVTVTEREPFSHGNLKGEVGTFTDPGAAGTIFTKVGRIVWWRLVSLEDVEDGAVSLYPNSLSAETTEDDPGKLTFADELEAGEYRYLVMGMG